MKLGSRTLWKQRERVERSMPEWDGAVFLAIIEEQQAAVVFAKRRKWRRDK